MFSAANGRDGVAAGGRAAAAARTSDTPSRGSDGASSESASGADAGAWPRRASQQRRPAIGRLARDVRGVAPTVSDLSSSSAAQHYRRYSDVLRDLSMQRAEMGVPTLHGVGQQSGSVATDDRCRDVADAGERAARAGAASADAVGVGSGRATHSDTDTDAGASASSGEEARSARRRARRRRRHDRQRGVRPVAHAVSTFFVCGLEADESGNDSAPTTQCFSFRNQEMRAVKPMFLPVVVALVLLVVGGVITGVGVYLLRTDASLPRQARLRYDDKCALGNAQCDVQLTVPERLAAPVYVWYELTNFYSNYRRYDQSRSAAMHLGQWPLSSSDVSECAPELFGGNTTPNNPRGYLVPCGLLQASQFNDTLRLCSTPGTAPAQCTFFDELASSLWDEQAAAWASDRNHLYARGTVDPPYTTATNDRINSGEYIVWQRISSGPNFLRLYRVLRDALPAGTYSVRVDNRFNSYEYDGSKTLVLGNVDAYGMPNRVLSITYVATGAVTLFLSFLVVARFLLGGRKVADPDHAILKELMDEIDESRIGNDGE